tara:strand:- start:309 stop:926 length:618 start_codon:yes stop_codon:yes gene_type:complete
MSKIQTNKIQHTANGAAEFTLPQTDGSAGQFMQTDGSANLSFAAVSAGITQFDQFYLSTASVTSEGTITSNLTRNNFPGSGAPLGTGMSESSGIFTFPTTGKYLIVLHGSFMIDGSDNVNIKLRVTTNNSSYNTVCTAMDANNGSGLRTASATNMFFLDVTDTSNVKVKFDVDSISGSSSVRGVPNPNVDDGMETNFIFIRIGDT